MGMLTMSARCGPNCGWCGACTAAWEREDTVARCPKCKCQFAVLEDEENMHDCPRCGYTGQHCTYCGVELDYQSHNDPYCSLICELDAEQEDANA